MKGLNGRDLCKFQDIQFVSCIMWTSIASVAMQANAWHAVMLGLHGISISVEWAGRIDQRERERIENWPGQNVENWLNSTLDFLTICKDIFKNLVKNLLLFFKNFFYVVNYTWWHFMPAVEKLLYILAV